MPLRSISGKAPRWFSIAVIVLASCYAVALFVSIRHENQTNDEAAHIAAGYSYWVKRDYRLNPEHPPLSKLLSTIPLLMLRPAFPQNRTAWSEADEFQIGQELLYGSSREPQTILLVCRSVSILFTAAFLTFVAFQVRRHLSDTAAFFVFLFLLIDANVAAHGRYVTSDIYVTAFFFVSCLAWYGWLRDRRPSDLWLSGVALGLALGSKFNAVLLIPVFLLMWGLARWRGPRVSSSVESRLRAVGALVLVPAAILFVLYAGDTRSVIQDPIISSRLAAKGQQAAGWERVPIPGYYWFRGVQLVSRHQHTGHLAYLLGNLSYVGFVGYFPVAFSVKTATGTLLLLVAALVYAGACLRTRRGLPFDLPVALLIPPLLYFVVAMFSRVDIGVRHILLIYPFLYLILGCLFDRVSGSKLARIGVGCALALNLIEFVRVYPHPLAFFNLLSGGPANGPRYLIDSNIDWGQGLIDLRSELSTRPHACVALSYFGRAEIGYYVPGTRPVPGTASEAKQQGCLIAVSVEQLYGDPTHRQAYLLAYRPVARPSESIYLYDPERF